MSSRNAQLKLVKNDVNHWAHKVTHRRRDMLVFICLCAVLGDLRWLPVALESSFFLAIAESAECKGHLHTVMQCIYVCVYNIYT